MAPRTHPKHSPASPPAPSPSPSSDSTPLIPKPPAPAPSPLPKLQLFLLCLVRLAEPVAASQIFPYINDMCVQLGYARDESEVGFVSGLIDSLFAFAQLLTVSHWGRLSDRIGRKPVILLGLLGVTLATLLFGLSRRLWLTVLARCLAGALSGNSAVVQTVISELTDESNESRAFPLYALMWTLGSVVGPSIGGTLSRPAEQFPALFAGVPFWETYPYFLPCLCSALVTAVSIVTSLFLQETLPSKRTKKAPAPPSSSSTPSPPSPAEQPEPQLTQLQILRSPGIPTVLVTAFLMMFTTQAWDVVFPLYAYTKVRSGGLSLSNAQLGYCLASAGLLGALIHVLLFPALERRFGTPMYPCLLAFPLLMAGVAPALNALLCARGAAQRARGEVLPGTFAGVGVLLLLGRLAAMVYPLNMMLVKRAAPSKGAMGSTYGIAQMVTALARTISPWGVSSLFAISVEKHLLGGYLVWLCMAGVSAVAVGQSVRVDRTLRRAAREKERERGEGENRAEV